MAEPGDDRVIRHALALQRGFPGAERGLLSVGAEQQDAQVDPPAVAAFVLAG
jgi:hypothetical protein